MSELKRLCVYCGASLGAEPSHRAVAEALGRAAALRGVEIVFGGGRVGLMGALADGATAAGGRVTGVIPAILQEREVGHQAITRLEVVESMHIRKFRMFELSDAFCVLPGGLGTLDETFEIITWKQLGLHDHPIVLLDHEGYWQPLLALLQHQVAAGFVKPQHVELFSLARSVAEVFEAIARAPAPRIPEDREHI